MPTNKKKAMQKQHYEGDLNLVSYKGCTLFINKTTGRAIYKKNRSIASFMLLLLAILFSPWHC